VTADGKVDVAHLTIERITECPPTNIEEERGQRSKECVGAGEKEELGVVTSPLECGLDSGDRQSEHCHAENRYQAGPGLCELGGDEDPAGSHRDSAVRGVAGGGHAPIIQAGSPKTPSCCPSLQFCCRSAWGGPGNDPPEVLEHLASVDFRIDLGVGHQHVSVGADKVRDALGDGNQSAGGAHRLCEHVVRVRKQSEGEVVLFSKTSVRLGRVVGHAENRQAQILEFGPAVTQPADLECSAGSVGLGIEEEQKGTTLEIRTEDGGPVMGFEFEIDKGHSHFQHLYILSGKTDYGDEKRRDECDHLDCTVVFDHDARENESEGGEYS